jgi:hypothetical protein
MAAVIVPLTLKEARRFVAEHHRHNEPPIGHRFSIGLERDDSARMDAPRGMRAGSMVTGHTMRRSVPVCSTRR